MANNPTNSRFKRLKPSTVRKPSESLLVFRRGVAQVSGQLPRAASQGKANAAALRKI
jgi:hypothetical protein